MCHEDRDNRRYPFDRFEARIKASRARYGFREPGFSKERRLEPQITLGLLTDAAGFPLMIEAFEGNKAEPHTMLPVIEAFKAAHYLAEVTIVADAGMISAANQQAIEDARLSFVLGTKFPEVLYVKRIAGVRRAPRCCSSVPTRASGSRSRSPAPGPATRR